MALIRRLPTRKKWGRLFGLVFIQDQAAANHKTPWIQSKNQLLEHIMPTTSVLSFRPYTIYKHRTAPRPLQQHYGPSCSYRTPISPPLAVIQFTNFSTQPSQKPESGASDKETLKDELSSESNKDSTVQPTEEDEEKPKSLYQRFKDTYKEYGKTLIAVHVATSCVWFGSFYYAAYSGIDVIPLLEKMGASEKIIRGFQMPGVGNVAVAYLLYKIATPARYTVTIGGTHQTVKLLRKWGYMEPVPEGHRIRDLYKEGREMAKERIGDMRDDVRERIGDIQDDMKDKIGDFKTDVQDKYVGMKDNLKDRFDSKSGESAENQDQARSDNPKDAVKEERKT